MSGFVIFVFIIIFFNVLSGIFKNSGNTKPNTRTPWQPSQSKSDHNDMEQRAKSARNAMLREQARKEVQNRIQDIADNRANSRRDPYDRNRNRVYGWGERAGPGILTLRNLFVIFVLGLTVLYVLSRLPASFGN